MNKLCLLLTLILNIYITNASYINKELLNEFNIFKFKQYNQLINKKYDCAVSNIEFLLYLDNNNKEKYLKFIGENDTKENKQLSMIKTLWNCLSRDINNRVEYSNTILSIINNINKPYKIKDLFGKMYLDEVEVNPHNYNNRYEFRDYVQIKEDRKDNIIYYVYKKQKQKQKYKRTFTETIDYFLYTNNSNIKEVLEKIIEIESKKS